MPYDQREAAIEQFSVTEGLRCLVVPVFDTVPTERFAEVTLKNVHAITGLELTPEQTIVVCSTPEVMAMYEKLGFPIAPVASLSALDGTSLVWPVTHTLVVARRPLNTERARLVHPNGRLAPGRTGGKLTPVPLLKRHGVDTHCAAIVIGHI